MRTRGSRKRPRLDVSSSSSPIKHVKPASLHDASLHNNNAWSIPHDLTIKVFSMLDTKSVIRAASCCTMLQKWSKDPSCYAHIDLTITKNVTDNVICSMIRPAGKKLRSLKIERGIPSLETSGLVSLFTNNEVNGDLLESLHLHKLSSMRTKSLCAMLSACPNLNDLKIVDFDRTNILAEVLKTLTRDNRISKLKHLFLENRIKFSASGIGSSTAKAFVTSCPDLISLTLIGFELEEHIAGKLIKGFPKLKYMDLSRTYSFGPRVLRSMGDIYIDNSLETLILPAFQGFGK